MERNIWGGREMNYHDIKLFPGDDAIFDIPAERRTELYQLYDAEDKQGLRLREVIEKLLAKCNNSTEVAMMLTIFYFDQGRIVGLERRHNFNFNNKS
jgi:hypothetical protein